MKPLRSYALRLHKIDGTISEEILPTIKSEARIKAQARKAALLSGNRQVTAGIYDDATGRFIVLSRFVPSGDNRVREVPA